MGRTKDDAREAVPWIARWFVRVFLVTFVGCAILGLEVWPFTGFRLFSRLRHETETTWAAYTVAEGAQQRLWFSELGRPYQGFELTMPEFPRIAPARQRAMCGQWLAEARQVRPGVRAIRIYRLSVDALPRYGNRSGPPTARSLVYACS